MLTSPARGQEASEKRAQEQARAEEQARQWPVRLFQVKYANVYQLAKVFNAFGAVINADGDLKVISVRAPQSVLDAIDEAIKRLDAPQPPAKNIELNAYLITASPQSSATPLPAELEPAVKQQECLQISRVQAVGNFVAARQGWIHRQRQWGAATHNG